MATPHSIEKNPPKPAENKKPIATTAITKAARFTVTSMNRQSIGRLSSKYTHIGTNDDRYIAYTDGKRCYYGQRFAEMDRYSQSFVVCHETAHNFLGHIQQGALLYKRDPKGFSFKIHNIMCDAQINWMLENLPQADNSKNVTYGVRKCQELGIVNWDEVVIQAKKLSTKYDLELAEIWEKKPNELTSNSMYHAMMALVRKAAQIRRDSKKSEERKNSLEDLEKIFDIARNDPKHVFRKAPVELGPIDLFDMSALMVRIFTTSETPAERDDLKDIPDAEWADLLITIRAMAESAENNGHHVFTEKPLRGPKSFWSAVNDIVKAFREPQEDNDNESGDGEDDGVNQSEEDNIIDQMADELNAHDDMSEAIRKASEAGENDLLGQIRKAEGDLSRAQSAAGEGDALFEAYKPEGHSRTPWYQAIRPMMSNALINKINLNYRRPNAQTIQNEYTTRSNAIRTGTRTTLLSRRTPRIDRRVHAKKAVAIFDTSGSIFSDVRLIRRFLTEMVTMCDTVNTSLTVIFADTVVQGIVEIHDAYEMIEEIKPKGGGGTSFVEAIEAADEMSPDLIIYLTDLMGTFPDKAPKAPIIWAFPPEYEEYKTPFGIRLPLVE